ncbi:MAG: response regulator [Magnetococcales bacterium]|nr:response regulator [Magnetococcales bacterium]
MNWINAPVPVGQVLVGHYDPGLVLLSLVAAFLGAYAGMAAGEQITNARTSTQRISWLLFGSLALGCGIFTMHFIGMTAFRLPVTVQYEQSTTLFSILPAMLAAGLMLQIISKSTLQPYHRWLGGLVGGLGIGAMHYLGMSAMRLNANMLIDRFYFILSLLAAVGLTTVAIYARQLADKYLHRQSRYGNYVSASIMAVAVSSMHYTAMFATLFLPGVCDSTVGQVMISPVTLVIGLLLSFALMTVSCFFVVYLQVRHHTQVTHAVLDNRILDGLTFQYVTVMILLAVLTFGSYLFVEHLIRSQLSHEQEINHAGRQRMLVNRIALMLHAFQEQSSEQSGAENTVESRENISALIDLLEQNHVKLFRGDSKEGIRSPESELLRTLFQEATPLLQRFVVRCRTILAQQANDAKAESVRAAADQLLTFKEISDLIYRLDRIVNLYQQEAGERTFNLLWIVDLFKYVTLLVLLFAALAIFRPLVVHIRRGIEQIRQLSHVVEQSPVTVMITNRKGMVEYVNSYFSQLTGYLPEEIVGKTPKMLQSGQTPSLQYAKLWNTLMDGYTWKGEFLNRRKDHTLFWEAATISPLFDEQGNITHFVAIKEDISDKKLAEEELKQAKVSAEKANQAKSDFLANMSHEIRTPMNAIIGLSHLCLQTSLDKRQKDYIQKVHQSATSLLRIINDILDYSKIEAGRLAMERVDFVLEEVLRSVALVTSLKAQEKQLKFLMETAADVPPVLLGDPLRLGQILINLTSNAIKFTERGEVAVATQVVCQEEATVRLQFTVRDTGIGMNTEQIAGLFHAFTQADASVSRRFGGTGLGLTIAKRLIEQMQGSIRVESSPGLGSRFIFEVQLGVANRLTVSPLRSSDDLHAMKVLAISQSQQKLRVALSGARILLVEDNEINRLVAKELLEQANITVLHAANGEQAVQMVSAERFDGVLMDVQMPVMDGLTATRLIRSDPQRHALPILAMTANVMRGDREVCLQAGMQDHIAKPIDPDVFFATLARWIKPAQPVAAEAALARRQTNGAEQLPTIAGLQVQRAMHRFNNQPALYLTVVNRFMGNQCQAITAIRQAWTSGDQASAKRLVHTLKGVAATLGADTLAESAAALEKVLHQGKRDVQLDFLLNETEQLLNGLCTDLQQWSLSQKSEQAETAISEQEVTPAWLRQREQQVHLIREQLAMFDAAVEESVADLQRLLQPYGLPEWLLDLEQRVAEYDFEQALAILLEQAPAMGIDLNENRPWRSMEREDKQHDQKSGA